MSHFRTKLLVTLATIFAGITYGQPASNAVNYSQPTLFASLPIADQAVFAIACLGAQSDRAFVTVSLGGSSMYSDTVPLLDATNIALSTGIFTVFSSDRVSTSTFTIGSTYVAALLPTLNLDSVTSGRIHGNLPPDSVAVREYFTSESYANRA
jgi:hypothetical protein